MLNSVMINEMKSASEFLADFSVPFVTPDDELAINVLKQRDAVINGYCVALHFSINKHKGRSIYNFQIYPRYGCFLPFSVVCKCVKEFLGDEFLYYFAIIRDEVKIYIWTLMVDENGKPFEDPSFYKETIVDSYEGLNFHRVLAVDEKRYF